MSARQNKKQRKGRNSANNRERTVTTLTEDPNTPYLVPTPSEETPISHLSSHLGTKAPMGSQPYQMSSNFGGIQPYSGTLIPQQQPYLSPSQSQTMQQSSPQYQNMPLPGGKNDLEILQNLKKLILDNQHPAFRAVPQPAALAKLYKNPLPAASQPHGGANSGETSNSGLESGGLAIRSASNDGNVASIPPMSGSQHSPKNSYHTMTSSVASNTNSLAQRIGKSVSNSSGSHSAGPEIRSTILPVSEDHEGRYAAPMGDRVDYPSNGVKKRSLDDPMDGIGAHDNRDKPLRSDSWTLKQPPVYSGSGRPDLDQTPLSRAVPQGHADTRSTPTGFEPPSDVRDRDRGAAADTSGWGWQDRNHRRPDYDRPLHGRQQAYHRPRRMSSASDDRHPAIDDSQVRRGVSAIESSQSHVPVDLSRPSADVVRSSAASDRPLHVSDESVVDSKHSDLNPDARVPTLSSRIEGNESDVASSTRPVDTINSRATLAPPLSGLVLPDPPAQEPGPRQPTSDTAGGGGGNDSHAPSRSTARPSPHYGLHKRKFQKNPLYNTGPNSQGLPYGSPASDHPPPRSGQGRPPSPSLPPPGTSRPLHPRSSSVDGRRGRFPSPVGGSRVWDHRGPPSGRDISRDRPPAGYRGDYDPDINPMRYGDRPYGRDYSPPPLIHGTPFPPAERGPPGAYASSPSGRDWGGYTGPYPPGNRRDWGATEEEVYAKSRAWEGRPPPPSERDRYDYPPRGSNWVERDYPGRDSYPPGPPPPPVDDRYTDRSRPPHSVYPPYNRVTRPRSPSPLRRGGTDSLDSRPPVKRPREEYDPVEYYPPPPTGRRGGLPPGEYPPPPRTGSPGPPGSGPSWPPPPSSGSSGGPSGVAGLPSERDYRYPPGGYERPRSPGPPRGRPPYSRGGGYAGRNAYPPRP